MKLHREGTNILAILLGMLLIINIPVWMFIRPVAIPIVFTSISGVLFLLVLNFFRSPKRKFTGDRNLAVVSSVDGKVVTIERTFENEILGREVIQVSVFMNIVNVHANWFPVDGTVEIVRHHNGRFMAAYLPKSSTENERSTVVIRSDNGQQILVRQIAGAVARRIVTYAEPGERASIEDHLGFIKFGSRVDIFLPLDAEILTHIGDHPTGGKTIIARLAPADKAVKD